MSSLAYPNRRCCWVSCIALFALWIADASAAGSRPIIVHVDAALTTGAGDGSSWRNAFQGRLGLQAALASIAPGASAQVWVADGEYAPAPPSPIGSAASLISFQLHSGIQVYGGFAGGETSLEQRDPARNVAILTGDLNSNDVPSPVSATGFGSFQGLGENSDHVVRIVDADTSCILDGVTIRSGSSVSSPDIDTLSGANVLVDGGAPLIRACLIENGRSSSSFGALSGGGGMAVFHSKAVVSDCLFFNNRSSGFGGGVFHGDGSATFINCIFQENVGEFGGGFSNLGFQSSATPLIQNCLFLHNRAELGASNGAGLSDLGGQPRIEHCRFINNKAVGSGGGMLLGLSDATIRNCDFVGNSAPGSGGGAAFIHNLGNPAAPDPDFMNCRFVGNNGVAVVTDNGNADFINCTIAHNSFFTIPFGTWPTFALESQIHLRNCIVYGNNPTGAMGGPPVPGLAGVFVGGTPVMDHCLVEFWTPGLPGTATFDGAPAFVDADGADGIIGTEDDDVRLTAASAAIDAGDDAALPADVKVDFDGADRFVDGDDSGAAEVDLGALEFQVTNPADLNGDGQVNGIDLALLLGAWGRCPAKRACPADLNANGNVNGLDLAILLGAWG